MYLFIDEFQRIVAHNLELILQTARSMNIGVILANQTLMDLKVPGADLIPTVRANTRFKQIFAASDLTEQQEIVHTSGETVVFTHSMAEYFGLGAAGGATKLLGATETITPRLRPNDVLLASDHPLQSIVYITRGHGYAQFGGMPFVMTSAYHVTYDEYDRPGETITPHLRTPAQAQPMPLFDAAERSDPVIGTPGERIETSERPQPANAPATSISRPRPPPPMSRSRTPN